MILCIDTAISKCSISLTWENVTIARLENEDAFKASEILHSLIERLLKENEVTLSDLKAIAINGGPGSYTGLRIGATSAKGLCYALSIPLIHIDGFRLMKQGIINRYNKRDFNYYIPMIDARRDEVYTCILSHSDETILEAQPVILNKDFGNGVKDVKVLIFGNGADKAENLISLPSATFFKGFENNITDFNQLVWLKYTNSDFENTATYSPNYLKGLYVKG